MPITSFQYPISNIQYPTSIIIPNWNGAHHLPTCLDSLRRQSCPSFEVIVVDNGSTDGSLELLERNYPEVKVVALPKNRGFAGGVNAGIRETQGELVAVFNNDAEADHRWLEELAEALARHPEAGMATPKVLLFDQRDVIHTTGDFYGVDGVPGNRGVWQRDEGQFDREEYVFGAAGVAAAYRRAMLDEVGLFDEDFFAFCEDVDLAWRAQLAGWKCVYVPSAVVYHKLSATGGGKMASYYCGRNFIYVVAKDYPTALLKRHWRLVVRAQFDIAWKALKAWRGEAARAQLRGQLAGLWGLPRMLAKRRAVQASRRVSDEYLESILTKTQNPKPKTQNSIGPLLSIIIPANNEELRLPGSLGKIVAFLEEQDYEAEVIVVENASQDNTAGVVEGFMARYPVISMIQEEKPGKGLAVKRGMLAARGEYLFICDADLSMPIEEVAKFLPPQLEDYDVAIASREVEGARRYGEPAYRHLMGRVFNFLVRLLAVPGFQDTQCGFKCFRREVARDIFPYQTIEGWGFDVEVLFIAQKRGYRIVEVPINWYYRANSRVSPIKDTLTMLGELLKVRLNDWRGMYARVS